MRVDPHSDSRSIAHGSSRLQFGAEFDQTPMQMAIERPVVDQGKPVAVLNGQHRQAGPKVPEDGSRIVAAGFNTSGSCQCG